MQGQKYDNVVHIIDLYFGLQTTKARKMKEVAASTNAEQLNASKNQPNALRRKY